jgi:23S rRNA pseudouridine1911/1915/1917 synthase
MNAKGTPDDSRHRLQVPDALAGQRLDRVLTRLFPGHSRSEVADWITERRVTSGEAPVRGRDKAAARQWLEVAVPPPKPADRWPAVDLPVAVVHADADILVLNKPPGWVVHPAPGHQADTLANGLLYHYPELGEVERAGIVHRLDRDTSGLLVVARHTQARAVLVERFKAHDIERGYRAVVHGTVTSGGTVNAPIGRHPRHRTKWAVVAEGEGKRAITHYRVAEHLRGATVIDARLETGRTHQVRLHMAHIGHAVFGDPLYGGRPRLPPGLDEDARQRVAAFRRQALHAGHLGLHHPVTGEWLTWDAAPPADFRQLVADLEEAW